MRVLLTRPEASAAKSAARLAALGHEPFSLPLFAPVHTPEAARAALSEGTWTEVAITSAEAVRAIEEIVAARLYAVGEASANAARLCGYADVVTGPGDGSGLAERIAADGVRDLLYLAGNPRAPLFEQRLAALGVAFRTVECYRMAPVGFEAGAFEARLREAAPEAILFYSAQATARFFALGGEHLVPKKAILACLSGTVAMETPKALAENLRIAATPDEESLLSLIA